MKSLSGTFAVVVVATVVIGSIVALRVFAQPAAAERKYKLHISGAPLPVKDVDAFKKLLNKIDYAGKENKVHIIHGSGKPDQDGPPFTDVKTANIIKKSETGGADLTGVNITQQVTTDSAADFQAVLNSFK